MLNEQPRTTGFVDGTVRPVCRPTNNQRALFNGRKRIHTIKFQSVVAANGFIANLYDPVKGKKFAVEINALVFM